MTGIFIGAFAGSLIELVEIFAVALIVGRIAGWHNALLGAGSAMLLTALVSLFVGTGLTRIPVTVVEITAGLTMLLFGQHWLRGIVRYYAGRLPKHQDDDENMAVRLVQGGGRGRVWSAVAIATAFKSSLLESFEIALVVVALAAPSGAWLESLAGALAALLLLTALALLLRRSLNRVPVKPMKFVAAMMLMGFGTYWLGEGLGLEWWGEGWALLYFTGLWGVGMALTALLWRKPVATA
jgi:uncharacterized membrane protein